MQSPESPRPTSGLLSLILVILIRTYCYMSTMSITLATPHNYDLQGLAETTRQSLALLKPWTLLKPSSTDPILGEIVDKAGKYVSAIQATIAAAYSGFTVTEEVLFLAGSLPIEDQNDLQQYLTGMMDLAKEARENANNALFAFRNVRVEIIDTMSKFIARTKLSKQHTSHGFPNYDKKDIEVLVKFSEYLSNFADWWDWIKIETDPSPSTKNQPIAFQLDSLTDPETVKRWSHLRSQYTAYVQMIGEIEDADPQFFGLSPSPDEGGHNSSKAIIESQPMSTSSAPTVTISSSPDTSKAILPKLTSPNESPPATNSSIAAPPATSRIGCEHLNANHQVLNAPKNLGVAFLHYFTLKVPKLANRLGKKIIANVLHFPVKGRSGQPKKSQMSDQAGATKRSTGDSPNLNDLSY